MSTIGYLVLGTYVEGPFSGHRFILKRGGYVEKNIKDVSTTEVTYFSSTSEMYSLSGAKIAASKYFESDKHSGKKYEVVPVDSSRVIHLDKIEARYSNC